LTEPVCGGGRRTDGLIHAGMPSHTSPAIEASAACAAITQGRQ
jgi:hypothetical protein